MYRVHIRLHNVRWIVLLIILLYIACHTPTEYDRGIIPSPRPVTDIDGNMYETVNIDENIWMAENLRVTRYRTGDPIPYIDGMAEWGALENGAVVHYENADIYNNMYGKLYNWYAAIDRRGICPIGWRVPTEEDWTALANSLGGIETAGGKMKARGTRDWANPNVAATNESGFSGLPGGTRRYDGEFMGIGEIGFWWSATQTGPVSAWSRGLYHAERRLIKANHSKNHGFSIRCIKVN